MNVKTTKEQDNVIWIHANSVLYFDNNNKNANDSCMLSYIQYFLPQTLFSTKEDLSLKSF